MMNDSVRPDYHQQEEFLQRTRKLENIRNEGIDPYPHTFRPTHTIGELVAKYADEAVGVGEEAEAGRTPQVAVAGRLVLFRGMGKNAFAQLQDETGRLQVMFNTTRTVIEGQVIKTSELFCLRLEPAAAVEDGAITCAPKIDHLQATPAKVSWKWFEKQLDLGDILGVSGYLFRTHKGELTVCVHAVTLLCKSLLPLPDKHAGLVDPAIRYKKRWLDMIASPRVISIFRLRSQITRIIRRFCEEQGFLEVETPILQTVYGGANARPFTTHHHALDKNMFLRISLEIPLKKLLVGGMLRVFELGKVFRNEGIDKTHHPEFTAMELYAAYADYEEMICFVENLFERIAIELFGHTELEIPSSKPGQDSYTINLKAPWKRITMKGAIKEYLGVDVDSTDLDAIRFKLVKHGVIDLPSATSSSKGDLISLLFGLVEDKLLQPHHVIDHPVESTPLCKLHRDPAKAAEGIIERFETFIDKKEFCNGYTELNDPQLQRFLLERQAAIRDTEAFNPMDEEFIEAICSGMCPAGGVGIGIDRLVGLFAQEASIRDVILFP